MRLDGRCHCGAITFVAEADPDAVSICHCTDCQALTGSAFRCNIRVEAGKFTLLTGEPQRYLKTTADSGNPRVHAFCGTCGGPVYATAPGDTPGPLTLRVGTLAQRDQLMPRRQQWFSSALPWVTALGDVPRADKG